MVNNFYANCIIICKEGKMKILIAICYLLLTLPLLLNAQTVKIMRINEQPLDSTNIMGIYTDAFPPGDFESGTVLNLNKDKTFSFEDRITLFAFSCKGTWNMATFKKSHYLCLTSDKTMYGIAEVIEREDKSDSLKFFVEDNKGLPLAADIQVESSRLPLDTSGKGSFKPFKISAFTIKEILIPEKLFNDYRYIVKNSNANIFIVKVIPKEDGYYYMNDLIFKIGSNVLYCPENSMMPTMPGKGMMLLMKMK